MRQEGSEEEPHVWRVKIIQWKMLRLWKSVENAARKRLDPCCHTDRQSVAHDFEARAKADGSGEDRPVGADLPQSRW